MADIRIKDLATTASSTASDDFVAIDGSANGTRKLSAYSPTFGGNLTVSGGSIGTAVSTDLTLSSGSSGAQISLLQGANGSAYVFTKGSGVLNLVGDNSVGYDGLRIINSSQAANTTKAVGVAFFGTDTVGTAKAAGYIYSTPTGQDYVGANLSFFTRSSDSVSETMRLFANGNLFVGASPVDSGNGKVQLATHTTSAGGIGFGTDTSLYRQGAGNLTLDHIGGTNPVLNFRENAVAKAYVGTSGSILYVGTNTANNVVLQTNATTALTLDSSQNAAFAGTGNFKGGTLTVTNTANTANIIRSSDSSGNAVDAAYKATGTTYAVQTTDTGGNLITALTLDSSQNATFAGNIQTAAPSGGTAATWRLGTVATVSPTSPNRTIEVQIGATTYYIHAKTTND